jgi:peptide alpha-N-acetyltransferase
MTALLDPSSKAAGIKQLLAAAPPAEQQQQDANSSSSSSGGVVGQQQQQQLQDCIEVHKLLSSGLLADAAAAGAWKQRCAEAFPRSSYFGGAAAMPLSKLNLNVAKLKQPLPA